MHNFEFDGPGGSGAAKASAKGDRGRRESPSPGRTTARRRAAPRPWRRWGGARYNAQHVFSRFR